MAVAGKTFGDFFDEVAKTEVLEAKFMWLEAWVYLRSAGYAGEWQGVRALSLTDNLVRCFAADMMTAIRQRVESIDSESLHASTLRDGRAFLTEVKDRAQQFGVDVSAQTDVPITPSDVVRA